ncbi:MAG: hypothetical protein PHG00_10210 [Methylococcales bacterium]|nr:hypothetical protein [Methylococcales bacterium]
MSNEIEIDLKKFGGPVYTGREKGQAIREKNNLDKIDQDPTSNVIILVPDNAFSLNSSFFLGLLGKSIRAAGSREKFLAKFQFKNPSHIEEYIDSGIERALLERTNLLS